MPRLPSPDGWKFRCFYFVYISQEFSRKWETKSKQEWFAAFTSCLFPSSLHVTCWFLSTPFTYHSRVAGDQPMPALTVGRCCCFDSCASTSIYMCTTKTHANISRVNAEYACKLYHCVFKQYSNPTDNPTDSGQKQASIFLPWKRWFPAQGRQWRTVVPSTRAPVYWVNDSSSFSTLGSYM